MNSSYFSVKIQENVEKLVGSYLVDVSDWHNEVINRRQILRTFMETFSISHLPRRKFIEFIRNVFKN